MPKIRPILLDLPETIETSRLLIRLPKIGEGKALNIAVLESLPELKRWTAWVHPTPSALEGEEFIRKAIGNWHLRSLISLVVTLKDSEKIIGCTGFHAMDWDVGKFETGYWCRTSDCGQGYMTESTRAMTHYAFTHLRAKRLEIRCDGENIPSRRIPERLGFRLEGQLEKFNRRFDDGSLGTQLIFARTDLDGLS